MDKLYKNLIHSHSAASAVFTLLVIFTLALPGQVYSQYNQNYSATEIEQKVESLGEVASVLYIAAHPDDENTRLISYFSNKEHYKTTYLSLTRGDGGQNLIGPEIRELLGVIRTQELLAARRIDGGHQLFSRANDFGYSKTAEETFNIWDKQKVLADVVWAIRKTKPDIIINRFDHRSDRSHGHHTASALLSLEAYEMASDPDAFPEQLQYVDTWKPKRLFFNTSWWFYGSKEKFEEADKSNMVTVDIGTYLPQLGASNSEIAAQSRSMHKCQGFGRSGDRGKDLEYLELIKGNENIGNSPMHGIQTSLNRIDPSGKLLKAFNIFKSNLDIDDPARSIRNLQSFIDILQMQEKSTWRDFKLKQAKQIMKDLTGLFLMASTSEPTITPGDSFSIDLEVISRNYDNISIESIQYQNNELLKEKYSLEKNIQWNKKQRLKVPANIKYSSPYWLRKDWTRAMYTVEDQKLIGKAENEPSLNCNVRLKIGDQSYSYIVPVIYQDSDPVQGEIRQPLAIVPAVTMNIEQTAYIFNNAEAKSISVNVHSFADNVKGRLQVDIPDEWNISDLEKEIAFAKAGEEKRIKFKLNPPAGASEGKLQVSFITDDKTYNSRLDVIKYDHIPTQYVLQSSESKIVKLDLKTAGNLIGYIEGVGDKIPVALKQMGYEVQTISDSEILTGNLKQYDAIVTGIRAYNTNNRMPVYQSHLMDYVKNGGTMVVQYNTTRGLMMENFGPYPFQLSHERVTDETAEVKFLAPDHPVLNTPNKITDKDFDSWVQERGLYFASEWDDKYTPILSAHDKGEEPRNGGFLVAKYGEGHYIYSGYSWFRELPAGVPGAFRIFANMVSLGNNSTQ